MKFLVVVHYYPSPIRFTYFLARCMDHWHWNSSYSLLCDWSCYFHNLFGLRHQNDYGRRTNRARSRWLDHRRCSGTFDQVKTTVLIKFSCWSNAKIALHRYRSNFLVPALPILPRWLETRYRISPLLTRLVAQKKSTLLLTIKLLVLPPRFNCK